MPSPNADAGVRQSAPYGHACAACSKAKSRCMSRGPGNSCERCHRMQKECQPTSVTRKRTPRPGKRTNRLEDKLDDLVNLLHAQVVTTSETGPLQVGEPTNTVNRSLDASRQPSSNCCVLSGELSAPSAHTSPFPGHTPFPPEPSPLEADEYLNNFRLYHVKWLPLVYIPPQVTVAELRRERPFLWLNVRALCCKSVSEKDTLNRRIREILAQRLMVDLERSIDLLLGLLIHLGWVTNHVPGKKMLCSYSSLAMTLVADLRLDRPAHFPCNETESYKAFGQPIKQWMPMSHRTNEERRATLTCFVLCSSIASFLKVQPMRWTPMMEHALKELSSDPETPEDEVLVAIVKICRVVDETTTVVPLRAMIYGTTQASDQLKLPPTLYVKSLVAKLDDVHKELNPDLLNNKVVRSHLFNAYATINSVAIMNVSSSNLAGLVDFGRTDCVYACVEAMKKCMDNWLTFTPHDIWAMSMESQLHFGRCSQVMYLTFMTEDAARDRFGVRRSVDLVGFLERGAQLMESVPGVVGLSSEGSDFFTRSGAAARNTAAMWKKTFAESEAVAGVRAAAEVPVNAGDVDFDAGSLVPMDFDDAWMTEMFMSWDTY